MACLKVHESCKPLKLIELFSVIGLKGLQLNYSVNTQSSCSLSYPSTFSSLSNSSLFCSASIFIIVIPYIFFRLLHTRGFSLFILTICLNHIVPFLLLLLPLQVYVSVFYSITNFQPGA